MFKDPYLSRLKGLAVLYKMIGMIMTADLLYLHSDK
jgi:hypothetical protein